MALQSKSRSNKRSSSSASYASTITMVVFVGLCFLGVWMLTSNPVIPPQTSTRATPTSDESQDSQLVTKPETTSTTASFEDNPGDLPDDAIKNDSDPTKQEPGSVDQTVQEEQQPVETQLTLTDTNQVPEQNTTTTTTVSDLSQNESAYVQEKNREQRREDESNDNVVTAQVEDQRQQQQQVEIESAQTEPQIESTSQNDQQELKTTSITESQIESTPQNDQQEQKTTITTKNDPPSEHEFTDVTNQEAQLQNQKQDDNVDDSTNKGGSASTGSNSVESFPGADNSGIPKESKESKKSWSTQAAQSENEKERRKDESDGQDGIYGYTWQLCNVTAGPDYIPCLDNEKALKKLRSTRHFEHRERHCPEEGPTCLVPLPEGYKRSIEWPTSRDKVIKTDTIMS